MKQRGSIPLALVITGVVIIALIAGVALCSDALFEDEDEENDLGLRAVPALMDYDYDEDSDDSGDGSGDCADASAACSDDDASPSFEDSPVRDSFNPTVCLPLSRCDFDEEKPAA